MTEKINGIIVLPEPSKNQLNQRQQIDYRTHRKKIINWMLTFGKRPTEAIGYSPSTAKRRAEDLDRFYRWVWDIEGTYTKQITHKHGENHLRELAYSDHSTSHKVNRQKVLKMYFRWRSDEYNEPTWEPEITFSERHETTTPRDYLTREERKLIREASLTYGSVPHYNSVSPQERTEWKRYLSRRFRKKMDDITKEDFDRANSSKIPSLVHVGLDTGLRPGEMGRAKVSWVDINNAVLRIPAEDAEKSNQNWSVSISHNTAEHLRQWIDERQLYEKYQDTDLLWLTREDNPYGSNTLKYLLEKLCEEAGIPYESRTMTWYAIRHSVGTYMAREEGLAAAQSQLRHRSPLTTMKYDQAPLEDRRDALDRMG